MNKVALAVRASYLINSDQFEGHLLSLSDATWELERSMNRGNPQQYANYKVWLENEIDRLRHSYLACFKEEDQEEAYNIFSEFALVQRLEQRIANCNQFLEG